MTVIVGLIIELCGSLVVMTTKAVTTLLEEEELGVVAGILLNVDDALNSMVSGGISCFGYVAAKVAEGSSFCWNEGETVTV